MKFRSLLLGVEALVFGGPITAAAAYVLPVLLSFGIAVGISRPVSLVAVIASLAGCVWALLEFWRLAAMTVLRHQYTFGLRYWAAIAGAAAGAVSFIGTMPDIAVLYLVGPPLLAACHFSLLQASSLRHQRPRESAS